MTGPRGGVCINCLPQWCCDDVLLILVCGILFLFDVREVCEECDDCKVREYCDDS